MTCTETARTSEIHR